MMLGVFGFGVTYLPLVNSMTGGGAGEGAAGAGVIKAVASLMVTTSPCLTTPLATAVSSPSFVGATTLLEPSSAEVTTATPLAMVNASPGETMPPETPPPSPAS